jgi:hypothetical protein
MLRRKNWDDPSSIGFRAEVQDDMSEVWLFAFPDRAISHKDVSVQRGNPPNQPVAVDPGVNAVFEGKVDARRAQLYIEKEFFRRR